MECKVGVVLNHIHILDVDGEMRHRTRSRKIITNLDHFIFTY